MEYEGVRVNLIDRMIVLPALDIARYEPEELLRRNGITSWIERIFVKQAIKSFKSPEALGHAYLVFAFY